ncbi:MAG: hypothetical protein WBQ23_03340 [Bacteroidota bacterium]
MKDKMNDQAQSNSIDLTKFFVDAPVAPPAPVQNSEAARTRSRPVFTGMEDHTIALEEASELTRNYRKAAGQGAVKGRFFSRTAIEQILMQEETVGIRYYYGLDADNRPQMVMVGVDEFGQDLAEGFVFGNALPISRFHEDCNALNT